MSQKAGVSLNLGLETKQNIVLHFAIQRSKIKKKRGGGNMAARSANVNVRVEPDVKKQAEEILNKLGVSASAFINMTYRQVILKRGIPFSVDLPTEIKTLDTMSNGEFDEMMQNGLAQAKRGDSVPYEEAFAYLMKGL